MNLVYSEDSVGDLVRLRQFIEQHNAVAAARIAHELVTRIERLREFPLLGTPVPQEHEPKVLRDMVFGNYIVRYAAHPETVFILRIWHTREDRSDAEPFAAGRRP